jgi:hypothetical protein
MNLVQVVLRRRSQRELALEITGEVLQQAFKLGRQAAAAHCARHLQLGEYGPWATRCGLLDDPSLQRQIVPAMLTPFSW